jgi:CRISPR-associated protein Cas2
MTADESTRQFLVIAYDIVCNRRRNRLVKLLKSYGQRANYSVFECCLLKKEIGSLQEKIAKLIVPKEDSVLYYPLCRTCVEKSEKAGLRNAVDNVTGNNII